MSGNHVIFRRTPAFHRNPFFLLKTLQNAFSGSFIKIAEKRICLFHDSLLQLPAALLLIFQLHLFPFFHDIFNVHLAGDLSLHLVPVRHHQAYLPVIFLGKIIAEIRIRIS